MSSGFLNVDHLCALCTIAELGAAVVQQAGRAAGLAFDTRSLRCMLALKITVLLCVQRTLMLQQVRLPFVQISVVKNKCAFAFCFVTCLELLFAYSGNGGHASARRNALGCAFKRIKVFRKPMHKATCFFSQRELDAFQIFAAAIELAAST